MASMKTALQYRAVAVVLAAVGSLTISNAARGDDNPPKELIQYVHDAKQRGVGEKRIREQAQGVGWSAAMVDKAIAGETGGKQVQGDGGLGAGAVTAAQPALSGQLPTPMAPLVATPGQGVGLLDAPGSRGVPDDYQIGSGDTLQIAVWKEQEVSVPSVVVRPDGKITVPLIKDVEVAGLTPRQAESIITGGLSKFYSDPNVTVVVAAIASKKIYLIGSVRKEGTLPYNYGMSIMQALSEAGGLTDYARRKKIYILRTEGGREYRLDFNYDEVVRGERTEQNILLLPGDTVVIPH
jgi:polysaccharide export outer membrane protein